MLRAVTWRVWAGIAILLIITNLLGFAYADNGSVEFWCARVGFTALIFTPLLLALAYTLSRNQWWTNTLGLAFIVLCLLWTYLAIPLAWVFVFDNGNLTNTWLAWMEVSAPVFTCVVMAWLVMIFLGIRRHHQDTELK